MFAEPFGEESLIYERLRDVLPPKMLHFYPSLVVVVKHKMVYPCITALILLEIKFDKATGHLLNGIIPAYAQLLVKLTDLFLC